MSSILMIRRNNRYPLAPLPFNNNNNIDNNNTEKSIDMESN